MRKLKAKFKRTKLIFRAWREYKRRKISYALFCLISRQNIDKTRFHFLKQILNQLSNAGFKALPATRKEARLLAKCDKNSTNSSKFMQENSVEFVDFKQGIPKNFSKSISSNPSEITLKSDKITINLDTNYPWIAIEVFVTQIYALPKMILKLLFGEKAEPKRYIVLDFGANRGYASLYFAAQTWCEKIYAFELFPQTFTQACENIALNPALAPKITLFNYGLGNLDSAPLDIRQAANERERERERDGTARGTKWAIEALYLPHRDGISSMNADFLASYAPEESENLTKTICQIRPASELLREIFDANKNARFILKIDVEGAEYEIMHDIAVRFGEAFERVDMIFGDTHPLKSGEFGFIKWLEILRPFNYEVMSAKPLDNGCCEFIMLSRDSFV